VATLAAALAPALPAELQPRAPALAALLVELATGRLAPEVAAARLAADPALKAAFRALAGHEVASEQALLSFGSGNQFGDITIDDVIGGDQLVLNIGVPAPRLSLRDQRNRGAMLARLRAAWVDGLLAHAFAGLGRARLVLLAEPEAVERGLEDTVQELAPPRLPADADVVAAFEAAGGALLLLGAPGAGKTILLIELARALIERAAADETLPIPVIFPLSSWGAQRRPLGEWLVDELRRQYDVPPAVAVAWRDGDALLPLLDGLDEVDAEQREACVAAINAYRAERLAPLVVCSRRDEYMALATRLRLQLAAAVQPLDVAGVETVLAGASGGATAQALLATDPELAELAPSPLMLSVIVGAVGGDGGALAVAAPARAGGRREGLVAAYVERVFERRGSALPMPRERLEGALAWLARQMLAHGQSTFQLEDLQPHWLPGAGARRAYTFVDRVGGALLAVIVGLLVVVPVSLAARASMRPTDPWIIYPLCAALFGGAVASQQRSAATMVRQTLQGAGAGLALGALFGLLGYFVDPQRRDLFAVLDFDPTRVALSLITISGLAGALAGGLYGLLTGPASFRPRPVSPIERVRWSLQRSLVSVPVGIALGVGAGGVVGLIAGVPFAVATFALADVGPELLGADPTGGLQTLAIISGLVLGLVGASLGSLYGLIGGLTAGLQAGAVTPLARPGEGLRRSLSSALTGGAVFAIAGGLGGLGLNTIADTLLRSLDMMFTAGGITYLYATALFAVQLGIVGALCFGGFTVLSHYALRLVLWRARKLPWRIEALLEEASSRALLRRVGGGYIFAHRIFLEHFAALERERR
jgi:hypothetical protein